MQSDWDMIVVGGGTAGMAAARQAHRGRHRVLLVQAGEIGGDCTFTGCVPSKTLIESAAQGLSGARALSRARDTVAEIAATESAAVFRREGIAVLEDTARFTSAHALVAGGQQLHAPRIVIATGSRPVVPEIPGLSDVAFLTNENVWDLADAPASMVILGGGPIGCELAQAFAGLGTAVTLVESADRLLTKEEPMASAVVADSLRSAGVHLHLGTRVHTVRRTATGVAVRTGDGDLTAERLLVATGREGVTDTLGLETTGVRLDDRGYIRTGSRLTTGVKGVFAAGDVAGLLPFTHAADEMGRTATLNAFAPVPWLPYSTRAVPWVTFTSPEVARVGLTEAQAAAGHPGARVAHLPMTEVDRARTAGQTQGFITLVAGPRWVTRSALGGQLLGATIVCSRGGELIHEAVLAMKTRMFTGRLAQASHAYPTWSVGVQMAAAQFVTEINGRRARPARRDGDQATEAVTAEPR